MKKILALGVSLLLPALLSGCADPGDKGPTPTPNTQTQAAALGQYELRVPADWEETPSSGENTLQFHFADQGLEGDCVIVIQPSGGDTPGLAAAYLELMGRLWDMDPVTQDTLGERQVTLSDFQMEGMKVSAVAFQEGEDLLITFVQGLEDAGRQQELAKAVAETIVKKN